MINKSLKIEGRSGCNLEILQFESDFFIRKVSKGIYYNERLRNQCEKQIKFIKLNSKFHPFQAPQVYGNNFFVKNELSWFLMDYVPGETYSEYIERCSIRQLDQLINDFINFIQKELDLSELKKINNEIFIKKINEIDQKLDQKGRNSQTFKNTINFLLSEIPQTDIPIGFCHGDLTLSNIIIATDRIYLVDFLDSFLETPMHDIVKLRQDTKFFWSLLLEKTKKNYQKGKIIQALRYFDKEFMSAFSSYNFYVQWYNYLEKLNLMRIVPYLTKSDEINFIADCLKKEE